MALNFSRRHFSSHLSEETKVSPMKIANGYEISDRNGNLFSHPWCSTLDKADYVPDSASVDILDVLPSDPFGMDINNTFTAITGWLEDLEVDYTRCGRDASGFGHGNHQLFAGLSFIWNNAMRFQEFPETDSLYNNGWESLQAFRGDGSCHGAFVSATSVDEVLSLQDTRNGGEVEGSSDRCTSGEEITNVHPAFGFCLYHLGVKDLLSVSMVSKSLHTTVRDDSLLWKHIHICQPLNEKITDEALLHLTDRAQGTMQCLRLVGCSGITDDGLKRVLERNPQVVKLSVPGCTRMTIDGVLRILKDMKSAGKLRVKHLGIGGRYGVTKEHFDELFDLLDIAIGVEKTVQKPRFYHIGDACVSCDDDRLLDIEMCPKCQNLRLVYDCPAEDCKGKVEGSVECRACSLCIPRCFQCGRCINDGEYVETFCLELVCSDCLKSTPSVIFVRTKIII